MHTNGSPAAVARRHGNDPGVTGDPAQDHGGAEAGEITASNRRATEQAGTADSKRIAMEIRIRGAGSESGMRLGVDRLLTDPNSDP